MVFLRESGFAGMMVVMVVTFPDLLGAFMSVGEPDYGDGDQLTCNVVLEGIGMCRYVFKKLVIVKSWFISTSHISILNRKGFPNRMVYKDFQSRYFDKTHSRSEY